MSKGEMAAMIAMGIVLVLVLIASVYAAGQILTMIGDILG